ncbi:MAG: M56 family metallopeptidase [Planctomycetota bacterium]|nr:M56 family metallopeptidase [Planctomycetota bacterium]
MQLLSSSSEAGLLLINVVAASILVSLVAIVAAFLSRRNSLSLPHGLLCVALALTLASPLAIWIASNQGVGIVAVSLSSSAPVARAVSETAGSEQPQDRIQYGRPPEAKELASSVRPVINDQSSQSGALASESGAAAVGGAAPAQVSGRRTDLRNIDVISQLCLWLTFVWIAVASWFLLRLVRGLFVIRRLRQSLRPATDPRLVVAANKLAAGSQILTPLYESHLAPAPLTLGWWRSVIVMPTGLGKLLDDEELACVLAHEAAHVTRHDTAIALLQQLSIVGFWWNPLVRLMSRQIDRLREQICDDYVVKQFGDGLPLAKALVKVAEWSATRSVAIPLAATLLDGNDDIEKRVTRLARRDRPLSIKLSWSSRGLIGLFSIVLATLTLLPIVRAQSGTPAKPNAPTSKTGWRVRIQATDTDGKPIANPRIGIWLGGEGGPAWHDSDRDGSFTATIPTRTPRYCYLMARADGFAPMRAFWSNKNNKPEDQLPVEFVFEMTKAITVGGVVADEDNKPIRGATVLFSGGDHSSHPARRAEVTFHAEKYTTDEDGRWRCNLAPETISSATINVNHPDYAIDYNNYSQDARIEELREQKHRWTLKRGFAVAGRVVDEDGAPIAGATLVLCELNTSSREGPFARTDSDGRYRFERVTPRHALLNNDDPIRFTISIVKTGFAPIQQSVPGYGKRPLGDSTKQERIVNFTLRKGVPVKLRVVDSHDQPIPGAWVLPDTWRYTTSLRVLQQFGIPRETNEEGVWEWEHAPAREKIGYDVMKQGFADVRHHEIQVTDRAVEETIVLRRPQIITGVVIDAESRQPIGDFVVERAFEEMAGYPDGLSWTSQRTRGSDGTYRKRVTMPPSNGSYTYRVLAEGYKPAVSKSTPFTEGETKVNFELQRDEPQPEPASKTGAAKAKDERETRLAKVEPEFAKIYRLTDNEVLRHIPEPLDRDLRSRWYQAVFGGPVSNKMEIVTFVLAMEGRAAAMERGDSRIR